MFLQAVNYDSCYRPFDADTSFRDMLTHDEIREELIRQIDAKILKQSFVAGALNIPAARVAEMRTGKRQIQSKEMQPLAILLGLTSNGSNGTRDVLNSRKIPILGRVAAGVWLEQSLIEPGEAEQVVFDRLAGEPSTEGLFAVTPEGDSMNLAFPANAIIICRHVANGFADVNKGDYVIVERENHDLREMTCKKLDINENGDFLLISESTNPKFAEPIVIPRSVENENLDNGIAIMAKVVRVIINYD